MPDASDTNTRQLHCHCGNLLGAWCREEWKSNVDGANAGCHSAGVEAFRHPGRAARRQLRRGTVRLRWLYEVL